MTDLCEHGVVPSLMGDRLSCKACSDALATENEELRTAIERAIERLEKFGTKGPKQVGRAIIGLEEALGRKSLPAGRFVLTDETETNYVTSWDTWEEAEAAFPIAKGFRLIDGETNRMWDHHSPYEWEAAAT